MVKKILFLLVFPVYCLAQNPAYYDGIDFSQNGDDLKNQLATLIRVTHTTELYYSSSATDTWDALKSSDLEINNSNFVSLIYGYNDTDGISKTDRIRNKHSSCHSNSCIGLWNREHVFPKSLANPRLDTDYPGAGTDAHNLRAADTQMNSSRGNRTFDAGSGHSTITSNGKFYPGDEWKGDVARIIMYMYVRYPSQCQANRVAEGSSSYSEFGDMPNILLEWNEQDPVSAFEINRNNVLENFQGNRNPFIDNPYLATKIWNGPDAEDFWGILSVTDNEIMSDLRVYPTVTNDYVYIENPENKTYSYTVINVMGQSIQHNTSAKQISLSGLAKGMYFINLVHENTSKTVKVILK